MSRSLNRKFINPISTWSRRKRLLGLSLLCTGIAFYFCLPNPLFNAPTSFVIESAEGELMSAAIASDGQWRFPASDTVPEKFKDCILAFEDRHFLDHPGIDPTAIVRAVKQNFRKGRIISGASTLDMQVIRLASGNKRTYINKIIEAIKALRLNLRYSKKEILSLYAANAPFGTNVVGLDAAAWRYFGRDASKLSWGEMAALAVLPNSPALVHPGRNRNILVRKRNRLLDALHQDGKLDKTETALAKAEPVPDKPFPLPEDAPHLLNLVRTDYKKGKTTQTRIHSTIQYKLQRQVGNVLEEHHKRLMANQVKNCAALILDVESGSVITYIGNIYQPGKAEMESHVDVIQAPRSPGSTLKPLLYAAMLNDGMLLPNSLIPDIPTQIAGYQPNNYDLGYDGAVPASKALARSLNVPAVKMLQQYRYERFHSFLKGTGISTLNQAPDFYGLSLILGGCEVSAWQLAGIYASMARSLNHFESKQKPYSTVDWRDPEYTLPSQTTNTLQKNSLLDAASIYYTFQAMNEVMRPGEELLWKRFNSSQQIAWKTGTSFGFRDAWSIGVTPRFVVCIWAGNTDGEGRPGLTGIDATAPILFDIFRLLPTPETGWFKKPQAALKPIEVCMESGYKAAPMCSKTQVQYLPAAGLKSQACNYHQMIHLDQSGKYQVSSDCESPSRMLHKSWFVLPPAMEYYYKARNYTYQSLPPFRADCQGQSETPVMELIYPKQKAQIYIPIGLDGQPQQVIFSAAHRRINEKIYWHLDNNFVGATREIHQIALKPPPGKHTITLVDEHGKRLQQFFTVLSKDEL